MQTLYRSEEKVSDVYDEDKTLTEFLFTVVGLQTFEMVCIERAWRHPLQPNLDRIFVTWNHSAWPCSIRFWHPGPLWVLRWDTRVHCHSRNGSIKQYIPFEPRSGSQVGVGRQTDGDLITTNRLIYGKIPISNQKLWQALKQWHLAKIKSNSIHLNSLLVILSLSALWGTLELY